MSTVASLLATPVLELDGQPCKLSVRSVYALAGAVAALDARLQQDPQNCRVTLVGYDDEDGIIAWVGAVKIQVIDGKPTRLCTQLDCDIEVIEPLPVCAAHLGDVAHAPYDAPQTRPELVPSRLRTWGAHRARADRLAHGDLVTLISAARRTMAPEAVLQAIDTQEQLAPGARQQVADIVANS
ncbi:hypothetical protein [Saccharothrix sp. ST-888]|uniref:hypothetical protein n=1 Tax=Saccharothrix sp. ST-888 TaxID=1427391 RepID=UPI0005EC5F17|nr:hypothetical protein [Saccharothrix sp. ST-888]KJK56241.1 hypothetical protein UK12_23960 [Saccharothrix sp. ST-888]